jgi:hypothetical protein
MRRCWAVSADRGYELGPRGTFEGMYLRLRIVPWFETNLFVESSYDQPFWYLLSVLPVWLCSVKRGAKEQTILRLRIMACRKTCLFVVSFHRQPRLLPPICFLSCSRFMSCGLIEAVSGKRKSLEVQGISAWETRTSVFL